MEKLKHFPGLNLPILVRTVVTHWGLIVQFTKRNFEMRHRGSYLGFVWAVLNPLFLLALYVFVFGYVFGGSFHVLENESKWDYGLGLFLGLTIFHLIADAIALAPPLITSHPNFVKKVVFPLEILPIATVGAATIHTAISLVMVLAGILAGGRGFSLYILYFPLVLLPTFFTALGLSWLISALGVFFRDIGQLVTVAVTGLMFASAIFYPASKGQTESPAIWEILRWNPLVHIVEIARDVVLWQRAPDPVALFGVNIFGIVMLLAGFAVFMRLKPAFSDVI
ncbi:MAG: ABC transporter permease [Verrucomicrobia bacterium]|nr:MAG: ABC transporter permease [Verrucomicrobiota bacterium]